MAIDDKSIIQSVRGAIFESAADAPLPKNGVGEFQLDVEEIDGGAWVNTGHTSNDNLPEFSLDGGDPTTLSTWLRNAVRTTYAETTGTVTWNSVQGDRDTLKKIYNGVDIPGGGIAFSLAKKERKIGLFILWEDTNTGERMGLWLPNVSQTFNAFPAFSTDSFVEYAATASILTSTVLPKRDTQPTSAALFSPEDFGTGDTPAPTVKPVTGVDLTPETATVTEGKDVDLTVAFTPTDATDQTYTVASSDAQTATAVIKQGAPLTVTVHGVKANATPATITITSTDGAKKATSQVTVTAPAPASHAYYGAADNNTAATFTAAFLKGLTSKEVTATTVKGDYPYAPNASANNGDGQYLVFALPAAYAAPKFSSSGFTFPFTKTATGIDVDGVQVDVWTSNNMANKSATITVG